jgi:uncharacterized membrane protein
MLFNGAQVHMLVNHLPVVGFIGMVLALGVAMLVQSRDIKRFALAATAVVGLSAVAPFFTGEPAEEVIEHLPGVQKALIHEHEEAAEKATVLAVVTGVIALGAFVFSGRQADSLRLSVPAVFVLSIASAAIMGAAAHEGGKIRHPEIIPGGVPVETQHSDDHDD